MQNDVRAHWESSGKYALRAVGTSYYRNEIEAIACNPNGMPALTFCTAILVPETGNAADPNAVAIHIQGRKVAYLSREFASKFRGFRQQLPIEIQTTSVEAVILNGLRTDEKSYEYAIELDFPESLKISTADRDIQEIIRANAYQPMKSEPDGTYSVKVWVPTADLNDLDKNKSVETWTTEDWDTVNFYVLNRKRAGLGFKVYEIKKPEYIRIFGESELECKLETDSTRIGLLRISPRAIQ